MDFKRINSMSQLCQIDKSGIFLKRTGTPLLFLPYRHVNHMLWCLYCLGHCIKCCSANIKGFMPSGYIFRGSNENNWLTHCSLGTQYRVVDIGRTDSGCCLYFNECCLIISKIIKNTCMFYKPKWFLKLISYHIWQSYLYKRHDSSHGSMG